MCNICCYCYSKSRSVMRGLTIAYTLLMLCYHLFEIYCDSTEVSNPHKTPISPFGELFDHMNSYKSLLYVSLVANTIVFIILFCLFFYTIMNKSFLVKPFKFIYPIHLIYYAILFIYRLEYALNYIYTKEPSDSDGLTKAFTMFFFISKILYISLGLDFYFIVRRYSKLVEEDQKYEKYDASDFETV